jgi:hypothetical protein
MEKGKDFKTRTLTPELYNTLVFTLVEILTIIDYENKQSINCIKDKDQTKGKIKKNKKQIIIRLI